MAFKYEPQWQGPLSGRSFERQTEDAINTVLSSTGAQPSDAVPVAAFGFGSCGSAEEWSRGDHVHPAQQDIPGNAGTATRLAAPRQIRLLGDASGSAMFDGSSSADIDVSIPMATQSEPGLVSAADKAKLDSVETGANNYVLPQASYGTLGGVTTTSQVDSIADLDACPIVAGIPYYPGAIADADIDELFA